LGFGPADSQRLNQIFQALCALEVEEDGLVFDAGSVSVEEIRGIEVYQGLRVKLDAVLARARIHLQVDVGFGDAVVPGPVDVRYPTLLDLPVPQLRAYPVYSVISEKLEALVTLGMANSRMKDFYDLWVISEGMKIDGPTLVEAIHVTFARRQKDIPAELPIALTDEFSMEPAKNASMASILAQERSCRRNGHIPSCHTPTAPLAFNAFDRFAGQRSRDCL